MLPINLLPNYIFDKNKKRNALIAYGVAIAAVAGVFIVWSQGVQATLNTEKDRLAVATDRQTKYNGIDKQIKDVQGKIATTKTKQTFIANAQTWNDAWPTQYDQLRNLTSPYVLLKSMSIQNRKIVNMTGFAANELLIAKWWIALKNQKDIFENVTIQLPTHPFIPEGAGGNANGGFGGRGMMAGMPGSGGMGGGRPMASGMGMGAMPPGMPGSGGMGMMGMRGGMPGSGGGGGGANNAEVGPAMIEDRPGINFVVVATLKKPLAGDVPGVPAWPAGGAVPTAGGMGGFPGMPGGGGMGGSGGMMGGKMSGKGAD